jgi:hypothetical protein
MLSASRRAKTACMLIALLFTGLLVGCTSPASPPERAVSVAIRPISCLADQAIHMQVTGLSPGELVNVHVSSTDAQGVPWESSATYRANPGGDVDLSTTAAISGSYHGVSDMGLIWSMHALKPDPAAAYYWSGPAPRAFTLAVSVHGTQVASASFQRSFSPGVIAETMESLKADGFVGEFLRPAHTVPRRQAVLVLGGSEGGLPGALLPGLLASNGYLALGVAYFGEPGLPQTLSRIPLEYLAQALRWLARQPGVDPGRIAVLGISRGSEAAQLLGAYYPNLVHAVVASVPSNVAVCSYPGCTGPAWTLHGQALPTPVNWATPAPPTTRLRSSRTSGSKARYSWTAARPTRHGPHAGTPAPLSACSTHITITGHTCCMPIPAPDILSGHLSPMSLMLPPWRPETLTTPPTSRHSPCCGPICSASSPD